MNKLEERFEDIIGGGVAWWAGTDGGEYYLDDTPKDAAKEAKDIAIDFAMYAREEWRRFHEEQKPGVEISWIILWEKFINQRYD